MDKKIKGSWLIHHTNKLQSVNNQPVYEKTSLSGKSGILLSAISSNTESQIDNARLNVLATAANISTLFELPVLLDVLKERELIDVSSSGIAVLGVTTSAVLQHTADIFDSQNATPQEKAAIVLAEQASIEPVRSQDISTELSDLFELDSSEIAQLMQDSEQIGFVDFEKLGPGESLLFNGNLFRRDAMKKITAVLDSLSADEQSKLNEFTEALKKHACISVEAAKSQLGQKLFEKTSAIGLFDINIVSNDTEEVGFITLPSAFSKYSTSMVDDAFDLAKAFVSSITYGMTRSSYARGEIRLVEALLKALVRGESVGPVNAIAQDYKILELKGVVKVSHGTKNGRSGPMLKLLKKEVGELALQAIKQGDVSEHSLLSLPNATVTRFNGPEKNRELARKTQVKSSPKATNDMLSVLRTGGGF
ncbi:hypothetical protein [Methylotenera mobilis]|uniref:Uncharacterized protein n=1 Tax=Methylotenera mobilis (strain JLW8 / ATCC BAA-1282 / DSM 17540) TaxID=583345 RepID=C6WSQ0_METML|nr:hypothetical protein [Methylotenera mobilis]ACT47142.1 conserved hypothetical protein [Methylotenera mobilis JLW8]